MYLYHYLYGQLAVPMCMRFLVAHKKQLCREFGKKYYPLTMAEADAGKIEFNEGTEMESVLDVLAGLGLEA